MSTAKYHHGVGYRTLRCWIRHRAPNSIYWSGTHRSHWTRSAWPGDPLRPGRPS